MNNFDLTVVIPTYNEASNIKPMLARVADTLKQEKIKAELLVIDDSSPDGTARLASQLGARVYIRTKREGPGPAILDGIRLATAQIVVVMDGDLSHPPEALPQMFDLIKSGQANLVIGSRQAQGGGTSKWIWYRKFFSWCARLLGNWLTPVKDMTSGYFMFDKKVLDQAEIKPIGCKVGLELMVKGQHHGKVREYPIVFVERAAGQSKMGWRETRQYLQHLFALGWYKLRHRR